MTYKINGVEILQPTEHRWVPRPLLGVTGAGQPVYPGVREYELRWNLTSIEDYRQLVNAFAALSGSSTAVMDLPYFIITGSYTPFFSYSGCILREPEYSGWFNTYYQSVNLLITNVRT